MLIYLLVFIGGVLTSSAGVTFEQYPSLRLARRGLPKA